MTNLLKRLIVVLVLVLAALLGGCGGDDGDNGIDPGQPPVIRVFSLSPGDIVPGDSTLVTYATGNADSAVLLPDNLLLLPPDTGQVWREPTAPTSYELHAFNRFGTVAGTIQLTMNAASPAITLLTLAEDTLILGDSTTLTWRTERADSIVISNVPGGSFTADSGDVLIVPTNNTVFQAIAYNSLAQDTAAALLTVEAPDSLDIVNGAYYRGTMGGGVTGSQIQLRVLDSIGLSLRKPWLRFRLTEGDGTLSADSLQPSTGTATLGYQFSGSMSYATIEIVLADIDTAQVRVRADTVIASDGGQGQYILFDDFFEQIIAYNGTPADIAEDPVIFLNYIDYEAALGRVFMTWDVNQTGNAENIDEVRGIILTSNYTGPSLAGIEIGSTVSEMRVAFGVEDTSFVDPTPPAADVYLYNTLGVTVFTLQNDPAIIELHAYEITDPFPKFAGKRSATSSPVSGWTGHRWRRPVLID